MLRETPKNVAMLRRIEVAATDFGANEGVFSAINRENRFADADWSGTKIVEWQDGESTYWITWRINQGSIVDVVAKEMQDSGVAKITSEERFFSQVVDNARSRV